ncbi:MAG: DNA-binding response regulator [Bacteroidetes bacterium]|nr:MAG: DNA-binding response regulator [Bacteroidota bacterium]
MNDSAVSILLVEDEPNFGAVLRDYLQMNHFGVFLCKDGDEGSRAFLNHPFSLCILDVMLPRKDGFTLAKEIRQMDPDIPIIFLTARSQKQDIHEGFRSGADDYIAKPFDSEELLFRIRAVLKRSQSRGQQVQSPESYAVGKFQFYPRRQELAFGADIQRLSPREADLLRLLLSEKTELLPREVALKSLWGEDTYFTSRSMDVFISKLRKRLTADPAIRIENVHGRGFRLLVGEE